MQRKDIGRRLAEGVSAKLEFDYACERANSFSEYYLHGAINEIVAALVSPTEFRLHSGYAHPALSRGEDGGPGRQREVDFLLAPYDERRSAVCIEAKWAGSSHCRWDRILLDLCRLTLIKEHSPGTECLFVISGPADKVQSALEGIRSNLPAQARRGKMVQILEHPGEYPDARQRAYRMHDSLGRFVGNEVVRNGLPTNAKGRRSIPARVGTTLVGAYLARSERWWTIVWRVSSDGRR